MKKCEFTRFVLDTSAYLLFAKMERVESVIRKAEKGELKFTFPL